MARSGKGDSTEKSSQTAVTCVRHDAQPSEHQRRIIAAYEDNLNVPLRRQSGCNHPHGKTLNCIRVRLQGS